MSGEHERFRYAQNEIPQAYARDTLIYPPSQSTLDRLYASAGYPLTSFCMKSAEAFTLFLSECEGGQRSEGII